MSGIADPLPHCLPAIDCKQPVPVRQIARGQNRGDNECLVPMGIQQIGMIAIKEPLHRNRQFHKRGPRGDGGGG